ncbi:MAG: alpha-amylase family glycosyl hydrolase [Muribaculaceae bacterium]|nr:alpha-amylase family glycosyl hydrolase [Muribaculaceae bacterium]
MKELVSFIIVASLLGFMFCSCGNSKTDKNVVRDSTFTEVNHPEWSRNAVIYEVNLRQYTDEGTIKAFATHLPRLKRLGVDILWFMPIHPISELNRKGELGSYYAVKDYKAVNPEFGSLQDFKELVKEAHKEGFKVILDWVPNHSGCDNEWVSSHPDWYAKDSIGNMVNPYDWSDVYKFDYSNAEMRAAMTDAMKFWVKDVDIDGYRCDVASEVPTDFWDALRPALDSIKPVFMLAESSRPDLSKKSFDMGYNWPMKDLITQIANTQKLNTTGDKAKFALDIDSLLSSQDKDFAKDYYLMNMITNHDLNSWEGSEILRFGDGVDAMAVLSFTLPGMPLIYTGQETGWVESFKFFEKDKAPDWTIDSYYDFYSRLCKLKHTVSALQAGTEGAPMVRYPTTNKSLYIFSRTDKNGGVYVFLNLSNTDAEIEYTGKAPEVNGKTTNYFSNTEEQLPTSLKAWGYKVFKL